MTDSKIAELRRKQDKVNDVIANALIERLAISRDILELKRKMGDSSHCPSREHEILHKVIGSQNLTRSERDFLKSCFLFFCSESRRLLSEGTG